MRVHVLDRPRIASTRTSSSRRSAAASGWRAFHRSRPARASSLCSAFDDGDQRLRRTAFRRRDPRRLGSLLLIVRRPGRVRETRGLLRGGEREQRFERSRGLVDSGRGVAPLSKACRRGREREGRRIDVRHLLPLERHRHPRVGRGADRPGRRHRAVLGVLVVVEEDAVALLLPPLARRLLGKAPLDLARDGQSRAPHLVEGPAPLDPHVDVHAARSGGLRPAAEAVLIENVAHGEGHDADVLEGDAGRRVEIDAKLVGVVEVVRAHRVRVQVDAAEVHDPEELRRVAHDDLPRGAARRERELHRLDPVGVLLRRALLVEGLALRAVDISLQDDRTPGDPAQRAVRDREVVLREVELRVARAREEDLVGVRDRDLAAGGFENGRLRHAESLARKMGTDLFFRSRK